MKYKWRRVWWWSIEQEEFGESDDDESEEIIDKPLSNEQMGHINGEFCTILLYFNNVTKALELMWMFG